MEPPKLNDIFRHNFSFTREQVLNYAQISGDTNPIHVSAAYGAQSSFGRCIVHGFFSTSIFSKVYGTLLYPDEHILISQSAKYIKPVFTAVNYIAVFTVAELIYEKSRVRYINEIYDEQTMELKVTGEAVLMNKKHYKW